METHFATPSDMRASVFFDGPEAPARYSRFWMLLVLSSIIASAGVMVATNSQVAGRVSPRLIDLLAALRTGVVGSVALVRRDISDTLPGVVIAISLVPPLTVVGLTLEAGAWLEALGALLLFVTNVVAIIATGIIVMSVYGVNRLSAIGSASESSTSPDTGPLRGRAASLRRPAILLIAMLIVIGLPLSFTSVDIASTSIREAAVREEIDAWSTDSGWRLQSIDYLAREMTVTLAGPLPLPDTDVLEAPLMDRGIDVSAVHFVLVPIYEIQLGD